MTARHDDSFRALPGGAQLFLVATLINTIGNGMLFAFLFIYFNEVRGFSGAWTGGILTAGTLVALGVSSLGGSLADRLGPKRALANAIALAAAVFGLYTLADTLAVSFAVSMAAGLADGLARPAQQAFTSVVVPPELRPSVSSWMRIFLNIGAGIGATIAGFIVTVANPASFTRMFLLNVASYLLYLAIVMKVRPLLAASPRSIGSGYRTVTRDGFFLRLLPLDLVAGMMFGLAFLVMPTTFAKRVGASERIVGLLVMSGALTVILVQLAISRTVRGRRRMLALAAMFLCFTAAFALGVASVGQALGVVLACITGAQVVGGIGEALLGPTRNPLTADLAPPELLGRYFGLQTMMFQGGFGLATAVGGMGLDWSLRGTWLVGAIVTAGAAVWALSLDSRIPVGVRLSP